MTSRRTVAVVLASIAGWVMSQSFTLSLPAVFRIVDANTRRPVAGVFVFALWKSYTVTLAGANPGENLIASAAQSNAKGWVYLPGGFALHRPMAPFSWFARDWGHFPHLLLIDGAHAARFEVTDWFWPYPTILFGSPPIAPPAHLGTSIDLQPWVPLEGERSFGVEPFNDALAFASARLSQRDRCKFVAPARAALLASYASSGAALHNRDSEFEKALASCH